MPATRRPPVSPDGTPRAADAVAVPLAFARTYMGQDKKLHDADSFGRDDLPLIAKLANDAHSFIFEQLTKLKAEQSE